MSKLILVKDSNEVFYAIPEGQAESFIVADDNLEEARAFYESDVEGQGQSGDRSKRYIRGLGMLD